MVELKSRWAPKALPGIRFLQPPLGHIVSNIFHALLWSVMTLGYENTKEMI